MNLETVTVEDCMDMFEKECKCTVINDGKVFGFVHEPERD